MSYWCQIMIAFSSTPMINEVYLRGHHGIDQLNPLKNSPSFPGPFCLEICPTTDQQKTWKWFCICTYNCTDSMITRYINILYIYKYNLYKSTFQVECSDKGPVFNQKSVNTLWLLQVGGQDPITQYIINIRNIKKYTRYRTGLLSLRLSPFDASWKKNANLFCGGFQLICRVAQYHAFKKWETFSWSNINQLVES